MTDDLTRRLAEQILRGVKELHEEQNPSTPLTPGTPVTAHTAAEGHVRRVILQLGELGPLFTEARGEVCSR